MISVPVALLWRKRMTNSHPWYMAIGGHQIGPVSAEDIISNIQNSSVQPDTLVYTAGMRDWAPIKDVAVFASAFGKKTGGPIIVPNVPGRTAHEIDFKIYGDDLQFVEVELDPGESVVAEAGAMMYMTQGIEMNTVVGGGSQGSANSGMSSKGTGCASSMPGEPSTRWSCVPVRISVSIPGASWPFSLP